MWVPGVKQSINSDLLTLEYSVRMYLFTALYNISPQFFLFLA